MQDKSINNALLALRRQIIRENLDGLEHVETLLRLRSVPMPHVPPKRHAQARNGRMRLCLMEGIAEGHDTTRALAAYVQTRRPELSRQDAYTRTSLALAKMRKAGWIRWEAGVWTHKIPAT